MRIDANARTILQLLSNTKYELDYYQREYSWQSQHVSELINDLTNSFLDSYKDKHERTQVPSYAHYFLGSIIISNYDGKKYIVDGQQRLTTLTLLLIRLYHLLEDETQKRRVEPLIHSLSGGKESFNLDVQDWTSVMNCLYPKEKQDKESLESSDELESVVNIISRYNDIKDNFEFHGQSLLYFVDWLLENVYLVEIVAYNTRDAYAIFETVNDRGLSLTPSDMLRGYVLSKSEDNILRDRISKVWRDAIQTLRQIGKNEESEAIKAWLRSQYAQNVSDFDEIGSEFHRWVESRSKNLELKSSTDFSNFIECDFKFYSNWYYRLRTYANSLAEAAQEGLEYVYYNAQNNFTLQYPILLSPLQVSDSEEEIIKKIRIGSMYLDILIHRRIWNNQDISQRTMADRMFPIIPTIRGKSSDELGNLLFQRIEDETSSFADNNMFQLHGGNRRKIFLILARMTDYVEVQSERPSRYMDYMKTGINRYEIEHIWPDHPELFADEFPHESEFYSYRNRIGGLLLLPKTENASIGDSLYEEKRDVYSRQQNLLVQSLHENAYLNNPKFLQFIERSGISFEKHVDFKKVDLDTRQTQYLQLAEMIWDTKGLIVDPEIESENIKFIVNSGSEDNLLSDDLLLSENENDKSVSEWTSERIRNIVPQQRIDHYETAHRSRANDFYERVAELQNFVDANGWKLPLKFQKIYCSFYIGSKRVFGVHIDYSPPKFTVFLPEKEFESLRNYCEHEDYCDSRSYAFYPAGTTIEQLRPILEYAYKKLRWN